MWRNLTFIHVKRFDLLVLSQKKKIIICFTDFRFWSSFFEFLFNLVVLQTWKMNMITVWMPQDCMACTCVLNINNLPVLLLLSQMEDWVKTWPLALDGGVVISLSAAELPVLWPGLTALLSTTFIALTVQFYFTFTCPLTSCPPRPRTQWNREQTQEDWRDHKYQQKAFLLALLDSTRNIINMWRSVIRSVRELSELFKAKPNHLCLLCNTLWINRI